MRFYKFCFGKYYLIYYKIYFYMILKLSIYELKLWDVVTYFNFTFQKMTRIYQF